MKAKFTLPLLALGALLSPLQAQSPAPIVVQAIVPAQTAPAVAPAQPETTGAESAQAALALLQQIKAANEEVLKRQKTVLEQLEEMEKTAEQIRIYSKRG